MLASPVSYTRTTASVVVAAIVALAGFAGAATAAAPAPGVHASQEQPDAEDVEVNVTAMEIENFSTEMELESMTMTVEADGATREVEVDGATIQVENANVMVENATFSDGELHLDEATVEIEDGQIEVQSSEGDESIDLSDTNETVEDERVVLEDIELADDAGIDMAEDLQDVTIPEMTIEGLSGSAEHDLLVMNLEATETTGDQNVSVVVQNGAFEVEDATVTMENVSVEGDTLHADSVEAEVSSAMVEADRVVTLQGLDLNEFQDVSESVEDETFQQEDVQVSADDLQQLLEQLMVEEQMAAAAR